MFEISSSPHTPGIEPISVLQPSILDAPSEVFKYRTRKERIAHFPPSGPGVRGVPFSFLAKSKLWSPECSCSYGEPPVDAASSTVSGNTVFLSSEGLGLLLPQLIAVSCESTREVSL